MLRLLTAFFFFTALACSGLPGTHVSSDECGCSLEAPFGFSSTDELLDEDALQIQKPVAEQYLTFTAVPKAELDPTPLLTSLDSWTDAGTWISPDGEPNPVMVITVDGWPALSRRTWQTLDNGTPIANWHIVVDLPDRRLFGQAWTLSSTPTKLDELVELAMKLQIEDPPRGQTWSSYPGVTPAPQREPLSKARGELGPELTPRDDTAPEPILAPDGLEAVHFPTSLGPMLALQAKPEGPGPHPVVMSLLAGAVSDLTDPTARQSQRPLLDQGIGVFVPTLRGQGSNPGEVERFWGEVDDVLAARAYLAEQPWVDPKRIVLVGEHGDGTLAILAAAASSDFQRVVVLSSPLDLGELHARYPAGYQPTEYVQTPQAHQLRSPLWFASTLQSSVLYLWADRSFVQSGAFRMERAAMAAGAPFELIQISAAETVDLMRPTYALLAERIVANSITHPLTRAEQLSFTERTLLETEKRVREELSTWIDEAFALGFMSREELRLGAPIEGHRLFAIRGERLAGPLIAERLRERNTEEASWTGRTDCERLDQAFVQLRAAGFVANQNFEDCSDCAWAAIKHEMWALHDGGGPPIGFVYYTQRTAQRAPESGQIWLSYGSYNGGDVAAAGERVRALLEAEGLHVNWDGDPDAQIEVTLEWKRRLK